MFKFGVRFGIRLRFSLKDSACGRLTPSCETHSMQCDMELAVGRTALEKGFVTKRPFLFLLLLLVGDMLGEGRGGAGRELGNGETGKR